MYVCCVCMFVQTLIIYLCAKEETLDLKKKKIISLFEDEP